MCCEATYAAVAHYRGVRSGILDICRAKKSVTVHTHVTGPSPKQIVCCLQDDPQDESARRSAGVVRGLVRAFLSLSKSYLKTYLSVKRGRPGGVLLLRVSPSNLQQTPLPPASGHGSRRDAPKHSAARQGK